LKEAESHFLAEFFPEARDSKDFSKVNVCLLPCFGPFVKLIELIGVLGVMQNGLMEEESPSGSVDTSLKIEAE